MATAATRSPAPPFRRAPAWCGRPAFVQAAHPRRLAWPGCIQARCHALPCIMQAHHPRPEAGRLLRPLGGVCRQVRPPAIVTEYMSGGSLRSALSRRLEGVQGGLTRLLIALDAAKVTPCCPLHNPTAAWQPLHSPGLLMSPGPTPGAATQRQDATPCGVLRWCHAVRLILGAHGYCVTRLLGYAGHGVPAQQGHCALRHEECQPAAGPPGSPCHLQGVVPSMTPQMVFVSPALNCSNGHAVADFVEGRHLLQSIC